MPVLSIPNRELIGGCPTASSFACIAKKRNQKKTTQLRGPAGAFASGLKPGDAETRFATFEKEAKLEHPHRGNRLASTGCSHADRDMAERLSGF
ncbi:MAG: hypothetical protein WBX11_08185 [Thiobacillaceae bacterium]